MQAETRVPPHHGRKSRREEAFQCAVHWKAPDFGFPICGRPESAGGSRKAFFCACRCIATMNPNCAAKAPPSPGGEGLAFAVWFMERESLNPSAVALNLRRDSPHLRSAHGESRSISQ